MLNRLELFGVGAISELISLHSIESDFSTEDAACDLIVRHLVFGACDGMNGELCLCPLCFPCRFGPFQAR